MDGILNIYKEQGYTSHDIVAILRKKLGVKRIGHTGTLDPNAEGVLVVCIGRATKAVSYLEADSKVYVAEMTLGITTDTGDIWGKEIATTSVHVTDEDINEVVNSFKGRISQIPPMYSAIKINGKKLYDLAREGIEVERKARNIEIFDIQVIDIIENKIKINVFCSKGTYIRTLCEDIGKKLGTGAAMSALERIEAGNFRKENSIKLDYITKDTVNNYLIPIENVFKDYDKLNLNGKDGFKYINGAVFETDCKDGIYAVYVDDKFIGIGKVENKILKSEKKFIIEEEKSFI